MVAAWSPLLGLEQLIVDGRQRFWDRNTRRYLDLPAEEERRGRLEERRGRLEAEQALSSEHRARLEAESRAEGESQARERMAQAFEPEKQAREALEARIAEFEGASRDTRTSS